MLIRWDKWAKANLDPAPDRRVGRRLIQAGQLVSQNAFDLEPLVEAIQARIES